MQSWTKSLKHAIQTDTYTKCTQFEGIQQTVITPFANANAIFTQLDLQNGQHYIVVNPEGIWLSEYRREVRTIICDSALHSDMEAMTFGALHKNIITAVDPASVWHKCGLIPGSVLTKCGTSVVTASSYVEDFFLDPIESLTFDVPVPSDRGNCFMPFLRTFQLIAQHNNYLEVKWGADTFYIELEYIQDPGQIEMASLWEPLDYKSDRPCIVMHDLVGVRYRAEDKTSNAAVSEEDVTMICSNTIATVKLVDKKMCLAVLDVSDVGDAEEELYIVGFVSREGRPTLRAAHENQIWLCDTYFDGSPRSPLSPFSTRAVQEFSFDDDELAAFAEVVVKKAPLKKLKAKCKAKKAAKRKPAKKNPILMMDPFEEDLEKADSPESSPVADSESSPKKVKTKKLKSPKTKPSPSGEDSPALPKKKTKSTPAKAKVALMAN